MNSPPTIDRAFTWPRIARREALRAGALTALGLTLADRFQSAARAKSDAVASRRADACILIWLDGGPSHLETFDPKPDAPREVRGPFAPIATTVPGIAVCEHLPGLARVMKHVAIVRSMTSHLGEHNLGSHYLQTGYRPSPVLVYPSLGAMTAHERGVTAALPAFVGVPDVNDQGGAGYLPRECEPFNVGGDPASPDFRVRDLEGWAGQAGSRLARRREFLAALDTQTRRAETGFEPANSLVPHLDALDPQFEQAYDLITSREARNAFDLARENETIRAAYGSRTIGQSCLLARRLVEAGVPFVTVSDRGWDTHDRLAYNLYEGFSGGNVGKVPTFDLAFSALVNDLASRGLLERTLVVAMGEFGRTPKLNAAAGRDHWPRAFSVALAGGGIQGGQVVGASDARGESPADSPVRPEDLACTLYTLLGIDPDRELYTSDGRPVKINAGGEILQALLTASAT